MQFYLGLDIAKRTFQAELLTPEGKRQQKRCDNTPAGPQELQGWLRRQGAAPVHACLEATGTYSETLAAFLHQQGHTVSLVNPKAIAHFAQSRLSRAKTDAADAALIAAFCRSEQPAAWTPPVPEVRERQLLVRRLESLQEMHQMEHNRLEALEATAPVPRVHASLQEHLAYLEEQVETTRRAIQEHLDQHPDLKRQQELLLSIPGIGAATAAVLLAELGNVLAFRGARQVAAFAGLTPRIYRSGTSAQKRESLCKTGSARLRRALYFPAMVALRFNPVVREFGERLRERGKNKMLVLGAAMRKLLHLAYGVLKSGKAFEAERAQGAA